MDIVTRLKMFLEQADISNSQFADTCKIPRPTLSQLLNGRNKKVSDEVIAKIHSAYPTLNIMWLLFGDGEMFAGPNGGAADGMSINGSGDDSGHREISFDDDGAATVASYAAAPRPVQRMATPSSVNEAIQSIMRSNTVARGSRGGVSPEARRVVNIMVFYSDGRFEEFGPSQ